MRFGSTHNFPKVASDQDTTYIISFHNAEAIRLASLLASQVGCLNRTSKKRGAWIINDV
jgi:hypothetical protein